MLCKAYTTVDQYRCVQKRVLETSYMYIHRDCSHRAHDLVDDVAVAEGLGLREGVDRRHHPLRLGFDVGGSGWTPRS